jgi:hypothetical protein
VRRRKAYVIALYAYHCLQTVTDTILLDLTRELQLCVRNGRSMEKRQISPGSVVVTSENQAL